MKLVQLAVFSLAVTCGMLAADWPQFRGPGALGLSNSPNVPVEFGPDKNVAWRTEVPSGKSSPVIIGDRIYITGTAGDELLTEAYERSSGKRLWRTSVSKRFDHRTHELNDRAVATPTADENGVYVFFPTFGLIAFDNGGKERWRVPLGPFESEHGMSTSPILFDGKVILVLDHMRDSWIAAYRASDGEQLWKTERESAVGAYSTPAVGRSVRSRSEIVVSGPNRVIAYDPETGRELWQVVGVGRAPKATPVIVDDIAYVWGGSGRSTGGAFPLERIMGRFDKNKDGILNVKELPYPMARTFETMEIRYGDGNGIVEPGELDGLPLARTVTIAIRLGGEGDVTKTHEVWNWEKRQTEVPTPLIYDGLVYMLHTGGILRTLSQETGELLRESRLPDYLDNIYASAVAANGNIYVSTEQGKVSVFTAGVEWKHLATNDLAEEIYATPAIVDDMLYVRTSKALYCFGSKN